MDNIQLATMSAIPQLPCYDLNNNETDVVEDDSFSYDGYQVVRSEFFAHISEPSISFNNCKVTLNTACMKKLPNVSYIQFLVNAEQKKLAVKACTEDEKDSFLWCNSKRKPRPITCRIFFAKIVSLMEWNPQHRYKLLGKIIKTGDDFLILFDLNATEVYQRITKEGEKPKTSRSPVFPKDWQNQFGLPVEEHQKLLQINVFEGYTMFGIENEKNNKEQMRTPETDMTQEVI